MDSSMSPADLMAITNGSDKGGFLSGNAGGILALIIVFILLFGGGAWGMGGNGTAATASLLNQAQLQQDLFSQTTDNNLRGMAQGQCDLTAAIMQNRYESAIQTTNSQFALQQQLSAMEAARAQCCCETNRNIDAVRYENAQNTAAIVNASNANTQRVLDAMCQNTIQDLRDKLQTAQLEANNANQSAYLIQTLRPFPQPAYVTCSPYTSGSSCIA